MKKLLFLLTLAFWSLLFTWCGSRSGDATITDEAPTQAEKRLVKIWVIAPLSWPASTYGEDMNNVYSDTMKEYSNENVTVKLIMEDWKCEWKSSVSAVQKLINVDKVDVILWGACSSETIAAGKIAQQSKILMLSPTASAPDVSDIGDYLFRFWNDTHATITLAQYLNDKYDNIAMVVENTDYAQALWNATKEAYQWDIVIAEDFNTDEKDFSIIAKRFAENQEIQSIVVITQSEATAAGLIKSFDNEWVLTKYAWNIVWWYFFSADAFLDEVGELANWLIEVQLWNVDESYTLATDYAKHFNDTYGLKSIPLIPLLAKEWLEVILDAIDAWNYDTESIKSFLEKITENNKRSWYFGEYHFDEKGDALWINYMMQEIVDGEAIILQ